MKIRIWTDERYKEPEIVICAEKRTDYISKVKDIICHALQETITGYQGDVAHTLFCSDVIRIYAQRDRVLAECKTGIFVIKDTLHALEEKLDKLDFVRISRSEMVNIKRVEKLDTSLTGTIKMYLEGEITTYVSRRNVTKIKDMLK